MAWIIVAAAFLVTLGVTVLLRDTSTPVDAENAAGAFQGLVGDAPGDPGVYSYVTVGYEEIDALAGARHDYPDVTYMTVTDGSCGPVVRWQPLQERSIEWHHCGEEFAVSETIELHEWFAVPDVETERCDVPRPVFTAAVGISCVAVDSEETYQVEVIGMETVIVGSTQVETIHTRRSSTLAGASSGETVVDEWRLPGTPLVLRMELVGTSTTSSAVGDVTYSERFTLALTDLIPTG
jgi:hypothetical protein